MTGRMKIRIGVAVPAAYASSFPSGEIAGSISSPSSASIAIAVPITIGTAARVAGGAAEPESASSSEEPIVSDQRLRHRDHGEGLIGGRARRLRDTVRAA